MSRRSGRAPLSQREMRNAARGVWRPGLRLWIEIVGRGSLGPGKLRLLEAIERTHSLAAAARELKMSYRLAWQHLRTLEQRLGQAVVSRQRGGRAGGGSALTAAGRWLLDTYHRFHHAVHAAAERAFRRYFAGCARMGRSKRKADPQQPVEKPVARASRPCSHRPDAGTTRN